MRNFLVLVSVAAFLTAFCFSVAGFYKLTAYENPDTEDSFYYDDDEAVNAYVGGDAYNYIINGTRATAYFVFAGVMVMIGFGTAYYATILPMIPRREVALEDGTEVIDDERDQ